MPFWDKPAFRCRSCGHLEGAEHAGENVHPHACSACGAGVGFLPSGLKSLDPDNWEVLADAVTERLAELGLTPDDVEKHTPAPAFVPARSPRSAVRDATDGPASKDKGG